MYLLKVMEEPYDVVINKTGAGKVGIGTSTPSEKLEVVGNIKIGGSNNELRFYEGTNYVGFEAPALTGDQIWVLPSADGTSGQFLQTDGSGTLSWATASGGGGSSAWTTSGSNIYYTTGNVSIGVSTSSSKFDIKGTTNYTHFYYGTNEDVYLRAGKPDGNVIINDTAKVGIGTASPSSELHVIGTANISSLVEVTGNSSSAAIYGKFGNVALGNHYAIYNSSTFAHFNM